MVEQPTVTKRWRVVLPEGLSRRLFGHLFPGDEDEHGAVILAGLAETDHEVRVLARDVRLARDGRDYVPGNRGYRMLRADFIRDQILEARDDRLVYLAVHNHGGTEEVGFSSDDLRSHERGYPALLDVARGMPVGGLVFTQQAVAGDIWLRNGVRVALSRASIVGRRLTHLAARSTMGRTNASSLFDRQVRLFGDRGQYLLSQAKVGIIGLGGVGSLLAEYLGRLGVGHFVLVDPKRAGPTNVPRLVGASHADACAWLQMPSQPAWLRRMGQRLARRKVDLARRNIMRANPDARVDAYYADFLDPYIASHFVDCDYLFLAADTMSARLLFNAIVHQYLIPGVQIGAKVVSDRATGAVHNVYAVTRPVTPEAGCLWCNGLINPAKLQAECIAEDERRAQAYVDDPDVIVPSVITLNALGAAQAANDFLFFITGLAASDASLDYLRFQPAAREVWSDQPRADANCIECGQNPQSRLARGDGKRLPTMATTST
jgi:hypothetical protein